MKRAIIFLKCVETGKRDFEGANLYRTLREAKETAKEWNENITVTTTNSHDKVVEHWIYEAAYFDIAPIVKLGEEKETKAKRRG